MRCLAAAAFAAVLAGCSDTTACTLIGCSSEASVRLHDLSPRLRYPLTAHGCFDERCADVTIGREPPPAHQGTALPCQGTGRHACADLRSTEGYVAMVFPDPPAGTQEHRASLIVRDAGGAVVLRSSQRLTLEKLTPNGERCGPICWQGAADFR